ncbi:2-methylaconitate cis-trans isomerase PrpF [Reyranella aquatilis]|uniref:2-methylaconitate cis-trans isomerase PrpF n=1 Tax=Reyranella aquatilis TaxID=2035356 RepID=A0ABS8L2X2_9HYPH|nr:2-methylaconitate cis-trans isomerase PrpF [Reyranella aquatilis]MCC8432701.1 2-methylaconitate cis-trans isomerase PrpF [Reyranella aquatilis]
MKQLRIPAVYMRGGTSKGVFFQARDLPSDPAARDRLLLRVIGSPDRYGKHTDGMGGATSSTSKVVILSKSDREGCDVDYRFGQVAIDAPVIDWSGNCGNLSAAVGACALGMGLVDGPADGIATVRIWQANIEKVILNHVPMQGGEVLELGDFELDGVAFPAAEVKVEFLDPAADEEGGGGAGGGAMFPTGNRIDILDVQGVGRLEATLINAGNPTIFVDAASLGLQGTELQGDVNGDKDLLKRVEAVRALGAVAMGLVATPQEATEKRPHTPKLAFIAKPAAYRASDGKHLGADAIDLLARIFSMGVLHHAMTGTGAVAIAAAAAIPGTIVSRVAPTGTDGRIRFGHPSGTLSVGAEAREDNGQWTVARVMMSRSARRLMEGWVTVPGEP